MSGKEYLKILQAAKEKLNEAYWLLAELEGERPLVKLIRGRDQIDLDAVINEWRFNIAEIEQSIDDEYFEK